MRKIAFQAAAVLALVSTAQLQAAQTQAEAPAKPCLTRPEMHGMVAYFLPPVLQSTIDKCTQRLAPDSYLLGRAPQLVTKLDAGRSAAWPMAKKAFVKIGGDGKPDNAKLFEALPEEALRPLVEGIIAEKVSSSIKPESCGDIDRIMAPFEPLPATNMIDAITEIAMVAARNDKSMPACPGI